MRVVHVATYGTRGGAARGATDLHRSLLELGADSWMVVSEDPGGVPRTSTMGRTPHGRRRLNRQLERLLTGGRGSPWSLNVVPSAVPGVVRALSPDVVNLHWIADAGLTPTQVGELGAPVVWTLRDMWPLTGGCHYDAGCGRFEVGCGRCPQIRFSMRLDASTLGFRQRERGFAETGELVGVALSNWLARRASTSPLWRGRRIDIIPPGVDGGSFHPSERLAARASLDLPPDGFLVGFVALHPYDEVRKGWAHLVEATSQLRTSTGKEATIVVTGGEPPDGTPCPVRSIGHLDTSERLRQLYAACDTVAVPSLEEAFGKVALEALSTGTSVVTFSDTGAADVVEHEDTGWIARHGDPDDFARGLDWALGRPRTLTEAQTQHERIQRDHSLAARALEYNALYRQLASAP